MFNYEDLKFKLKELNPIESVVGEYVNLKRSGASFKGLCPFHDEKTASFYVNPAKGFFHCFGCSKSGDVITFIQEIEHVDFNDALEILAKKSGIDISQYKRSGDRGSTTTIYDANETAMKFFKSTLMQSVEIIDYLKKRGLSETDIENFKLGYSDSKKSLSSFIREKHFKYDDFVKAGLLYRDNTGGIRDVFYNRIMFPIFSNSGNIIGFGGRTLSEDGPKYLNTAETSVFKKGNFLYGLNMSKTHIGSRNTAVLVEGYMDFISLFKAGVTNCTAQLGTACTQVQSKLLKRMAERVILMYDSDEAGKNATMRSIPILLKDGILVSVFYDETVKDPDELVAKMGTVDPEYIESGAVHFIDFAEKYFNDREDDRMLAKKHFINYLIDAVKNIEDPVVRNLYAGDVSRRVHISEKHLQSEKTEKGSAEKAESKGINMYHEILGLMLSDSSYCRKICQEVEEDDFLELSTKGIYVNICNSIVEGEIDNIDLLIKNDTMTSFKDYIIKRMMYYTENKPDEKKVTEFIENIKKKRIKKKIDEIDINIKNTSDEEEKDRLMQMRALLQSKIKGGK